MSVAGNRLIRAANEALAIAGGEMERGAYAVHTSLADAEARAIRRRNGVVHTTKAPKAAATRF